MLVPELTVGAVAPMIAWLRTAGWAFVLEPEDRWYRTGDHKSGQRQFVVADPDGGLLRPAQALGSRPL